MQAEGRSVALERRPLPPGLALPSYNEGVPIPQKPGASETKHARHHVYATETTGLLLIAILLLVLTLIRYWHFINWSIH
jgi:hypothetical protein